MIELRKFQSEFIRRATAPNVDTAALSLPRGNGKSWLAGHLAARIMTPGDSLFRAGTESIVLAATLEQGRIVFRFMRELLGDNRDYRWSDSLTRVQVVHKPTRTALIVRGANAKATFGLVNTPWVIADEPGAWKVLDGETMHHSIQTAQGKPGSPLTALYIGTLAPSLGRLVARPDRARYGREYLREAAPRRPGIVGQVAHHPAEQSVDGNCTGVQEEAHRRTQRGAG